MLFPSLPDDAGVRHALRINPAAGRALAAHHQEVMRGESPLSPGERELIAAYVSGLNQCAYCHGSHKEAAVAFGVSRDLIEDLVADKTLAGAPPKLRPILAYARKLTLDHTRMTPADAEAVFQAGWDERALHDAILVIAMFNFMNRFVHGHGILGNEAIWAEGGRYLHDMGYNGVLERA